MQFWLDEGACEVSGPSAMEDQSRERSGSLQPQFEFERIQGVDVSATLFGDPVAFVMAARRGLSGDVVRQAVGVLGCRELFVGLMGTTSGNLNRFYRRKTLSQAQSEALLDTLRVFSKAIAAFGNLDKAREWMNSTIPTLGSQRPVDLCDTFEGRNLVRTVLRKIEYGEFA